MEIKLTNSKNEFAIVSEIDHPLISKNKWHKNSCGYAKATIEGIQI